MWVLVEIHSFSHSFNIEHIVKLGQFYTVFITVLLTLIVSEINYDSC